MEQTNQSLFELQMDQESNLNLSEAAKWAKFLAIVGFVMCGLVVVIAIFAGSILSSLFSTASGGVNMISGTVISVFYMMVALIYFFPCLYLFRFATKMQIALRQNDQIILNASFRNLKACFRFVGILTIIVISLYLLIFVIAIIGAIGVGR